MKNKPKNQPERTTLEHGRWTECLLCREKYLYDEDHECKAKPEPEAVETDSISTTAVIIGLRLGHSVIPHSHIADRLASQQQKIEKEKTRVHTHQCTELYNKGFYNTVSYSCICGGEGFANTRESHLLTNVLQDLEDIEVTADKHDDSIIERLAIKYREDIEKSLTELEQDK